MKSHTPSRDADCASPVPPGTAHITAFDFDGTLTWKDSFTAFLFDSFGMFRTGFAFLRRPSLLLDYLRTHDRGALKSRLLFALAGPVPRRELEARIEVFAARTGMSLFRPDALETWRSAEGLKVIVTASPNIVVAPLGGLIGADRVIGTRLAFDEAGRLLPDLDGPNCRGPEKMCRLREAFGDDVVILAAYGDTAGDREMLAAAGHAGYRVFHDRP